MSADDPEPSAERLQLQRDLLAQQKQARVAGASRRDLELAAMGLGPLRRFVSPARARAALAAMPFEHAIRHPRAPSFYGPPPAPKQNMGTVTGRTLPAEGPTEQDWNRIGITQRPPWKDPVGDLRAVMEQANASLGKPDKPRTLTLPQYAETALREQLGLVPRELGDGLVDWGEYSDPNVGLVHVYTQRPRS